MNNLQSVPLIRIAFGMSLKNPCWGHQWALFSCSSSCGPPPSRTKGICSPSRRPPQAAVLTMAIGDSQILAPAIPSSIVDSLRLNSHSISSVTRTRLLFVSTQSCRKHKIHCCKIQDSNKISFCLFDFYYTTLTISKQCLAIKGLQRKYYKFNTKYANGPLRLLQKVHTCFLTYAHTLLFCFGTKLQPAGVVDSIAGPIPASSSANIYCFIQCKFGCTQITFCFKYSCLHDCYCCCQCIQFWIDKNWKSHWVGYNFCFFSIGLLIFALL